MEEKKKLDWKTVVILILAALLLFSFAKINELSSQNQSMKNDINHHANELNRLSQQINSIYNNVDEQMKKEASLLSGVSYSLGDLSADKTSTAFNVSVVPKQITDGMKLSVTLDGQTAELTKNGSSFDGSINVGLFVDYDQHPLLTIETADGIKTEYLEDVHISYMFSRFLPTLYANMSGRATHSGNRLNVNQDLTVDCKPANSNSTVEFISYTLIEELNGKEIGREDITDKVKAADNAYRAEYNKSFETSIGDTLAVYIVAEDSLGYIHKAFAYYWHENDDGAVAEVMSMYGDEFIYDKNGNLLYPVGMELYY